MKLHDVNKGVHKNKRKRRVGRGIGSGWGKTAGRGHKGQGQLAGWTSHPAFEGGQMPLVRRVPKRGFNNQWARSVAAVNVGSIDARFEAGAAVTPESLKACGLVKGRYDLLKVLGNGELTKKLVISAHAFSKSAMEKIEKAGGQRVVLPGPAPVARPEKKKSKKQASK